VEITFLCVCSIFIRGGIHPSAFESNLLTKLVVLLKMWNKLHLPFEACDKL